MTETAQGWRPSMFDLWRQARGDGDCYRELLREWGHVLRPGDEGYEQASPSLPCGWPGERLTPDKTWPDPETLGVLLEAGLREEDGRGCE